MPTATDPLDCVCHHLRRTARAVTAVYDEALRPTGLRSTQFTLLHLLSLKDGVALVPLSRKAGMDRTTLARSLQTLEQLNLVRLSDDANDKRKMLAHLTGEGRAAMDAAFPLWQKAQKQMLKALSKKSWEKVYKRLETIEQALEATPDAKPAKSEKHEKHEKTK